MPDNRRFLLNKVALTLLEAEDFKIAHIKKALVHGERSGFKKNFNPKNI